MYIQNRYILSFLLILNINFCYLKACNALNPNDYGTCLTIIGYAWVGEECVIVSGCDTNGDEDSFFDTFEECSLTCFNHASLGDINDDSQINVIDVVLLVNMILG